MGKDVQPSSHATTPPTKASTIGMSSSTSSIQVYKKRKDKAPMIESQVRRSCRIQQLNHGYRKKTCMDRNCLPCNANPPSISSKVVKILSVTFCKIPEKDCSDDALHQTKKKKGGEEKEEKEKSKKVPKKGGASSPA